MHIHFIYFQYLDADLSNKTGSDSLDCATVEVDKQLDTERIIAYLESLSGQYRNHSLEDVTDALESDITDQHTVNKLSEAKLNNRDKTFQGWQHITSEGNTVYSSVPNAAKLANLKASNSTNKDLSCMAACEAKTGMFCFSFSYCSNDIALWHSNILQTSLSLSLSLSLSFNVSIFLSASNSLVSVLSQLVVCFLYF